MQTKVYKIWVKIGNYGTPEPFEYKPLKKNDINDLHPLIIKECYRLYENYLKQKKLPIEGEKKIIVTDQNNEIITETKGEKE